MLVEIQPSLLTAKRRTMRTHSVAGIACALLLTFAGSASATTYNESVDGDLGPFGAPTVLALDIGSNTILGAVGPIGPDRNDGFASSTGLISAIILEDYVNPGAFGDFSSGFFALTDLGTVLQGSDIDVNSIGTDLLTLLGPTPPGETVTGYFLDEQNSTATYRLNVQTVPEPTTLGLMSLAVIGLAIRRRITTSSAH